MKDSDRILHAFARDLSTRTEQEVAGEWSGQKLKALQKVSPGLYDSVLPNHNPIYFLAEKVWFDNQTAKDPLLFHEFHRDKICKALLDYYMDPAHDSAGLLILAQRDSFKTTFAHGVFPQFISLREKYVNHKDVRLSLIHHKEKMASDNLVLLRAKSITSKWLRQFWPEFCADEDWGNSIAFDWPCKVKGRLKEASVIAAGLGTRLVGSHFDWMLFDDIVTDEHARSQVIRMDSMSRYNASLFMMDTKSGKQVLTGTRYHINDLYKKILDTDDFKKIIIRAGGTDVDEPLSFPSRHSQAILDRKRKYYHRIGDEIQYWMQYQLEPKTGHLVATEAEWLRYAKDEDIPGVGKQGSLYKVILVDPAWKGTKNSGSGDYAAIAVVGLERIGVMVKRYLLDLAHSNELTAQDGINVIFALMQKWHVTDVAVEESGGYTFRTLLDQEALTRGKHLFQPELKSKQRGKAERIVTFLKHVQSGHFIIREDCDNLEAFKSQFLDYPQVEHDDALDAVAYCCDPSIVNRAPASWNEEGEDSEMYDDDLYDPQRTLHCAY